MVLDEDIVSAVITDDIDAVKAWLAADQSRDVNDFATFLGSDMKFTLLSIAVTGRRDEATRPRRATGPRRYVPVQTRRQWRRVENPRVLASDAVTRLLWVIDLLAL